MTSCHVAHDCRVGDSCVISNAVLLAGHITVGDRVVLSGGVAIHHFVAVGDFAFVGGMSRVVKDIPPYLITEGDPAEARAVNVVGLRRGGFSEETISALEDTFKAIFRSDDPMSVTLARLDASSHGPEVTRLIDFMKRRSAGKHGRANQP